MAVGFSNVKISGVLVGRREDASPTLSAFTRIRPKRISPDQNKNIRTFSFSHPIFQTIF